MTTPDDLAPNEKLGRGVFSSDDQKRAQRLGKVRPKVFLEKRGNTEISVNRIDCMSPQEEAAIGNKLAALRKRTFYGWAIVTVKQACANHRRVSATPQDDNRYHADIILPDPAGEDYEEQMRHAQELADTSCWRARP